MQAGLSPPFLSLRGVSMQTKERLPSSFHRRASLLSFVFLHLLKIHRPRSHFRAPPTPRKRLFLRPLLLRACHPGKRGRRRRRAGLHFHQSCLVSMGVEEDEEVTHGATRNNGTTAFSRCTVLKPVGRTQLKVGHVTNRPLCNAHSSLSSSPPH